ncbi:TetR/AcrR family transcriptional regulator [Nonomuraea africana]|uniref:AcrR family transcriptional regulator n=1 Tax=Nonomuraea africana TaxID=46171 RepID=A0ABR9KA79_9ACTN|nr:TetR/AcrR family transcriptional regulator [Nonomuraea africana]MBE1558917.1 AcrR family transcriptional regulator [Nonomuraea africana]
MEEGLRERKKRETRRRIADMAMGLFMARGFEQVTVAEVARAADVSVNTVFNYFGTKEDLFLDREEEVEDLQSKVVHEREKGESVVAAFRRDFMAAIEERDWRYGLNDGSDVFARIVGDSPSLMARFRDLEHTQTQRLARTLAEESGAEPDDLTPHLVAAHILETTRRLSRHATALKLAGVSWAEIRPLLIRQTEQAFDLLERGISDYCVRM